MAKFADLPARPLASLPLTSYTQDVFRLMFHSDTSPSYDTLSTQRDLGRNLTDTASK